MEDRQRLLGGAGGAGYLDLGQCREQTGEAVTEDGMVIGDQDPGHAGTAGAGAACGGAVSTGSRAATVTPGEARRSGRSARHDLPRSALETTGHAR